MWFLVLGAVLLAAAIAAGIAWATLRDDGGAQASGVDGACVRQTFAPLPRAPHLEGLEGGKLPDDFEYNSFPPSSGYHSGQTAIWNVYEDPVPEQNLIHNLEHGGVIVQYGSEVPPQTVQEIVSWYAESPEGIIVAPLPESISDAPAPPADAQEKIFLTAWTHVAACSAFDEDAFTNFRDDYRGPDGDAPEKFPLEALQPGGQ
jgi:Protein of unknown function (DUF3105)